nr:EOG090X09KD [Triops cancriformis]
MPCWYYDKKDLRNTPSIQGGLDYETECRYRREGARFIIDVGTKMGLRYDTMATGVVYFHRFYMFHTFQEFPRYVTACCCLFLAGKVEETPKKCKDIIKAAKGLLSDAHFSQFGADPKEEVMTMERILLQTIEFDLQVEHPYRYLIQYAKCLRGDKVKLQKMVQMAWTFVNDSLCTTLCLQWEPEIIGIALIYLAGKLSKFEVQDWKDKQPRHLRWWDAFVEDITLDILEDTCHQVLDLYSQTQTSRPDSPLLNTGNTANVPAQPPLPNTRRPEIPAPPSNAGKIRTSAFDERLEAMQPRSAEMSASMGAASYMLGFPLPNAPYPYPYAYPVGTNPAPRVPGAPPAPPAPYPAPGAASYYSNAYYPPQNVYPAPNTAQPTSGSAQPSNPLPPRPY